MGKKNKRHAQKNSRQSKKKNRQAQEYIAPLSQEQIEELTTEALCVMSLLKQSKETLSKPEAHQSYVLSKPWLDKWKIYVGYEEVTKGQEVKINNKKYGRSPPGQINLDLALDNPEQEFHVIPDECIEYDFLRNPLKNDVHPGKDYILVDLDCWDFLFGHYGGKKIKRQSNEKGEFNLSTLRPYFIFCDPNIIKEIQRLDESELSNNTQILDHKRLLMPTSWDYEQLCLLVRAMSSEQTNKMVFRLWRIEPFVTQENIKNALLRTIYNKKYAILGTILDQTILKDLKLGEFLKSHYTVLVEYQKKNEQYKFTRSQKSITKGQMGVCETCGVHKKLNYACVCVNFLYCSQECRYRDQIFHGGFCDKAYDSEDDEELEHIQSLNNPLSQPNGLNNLGNTCYMNSALQILLSSKNFQQFLISRQYYCKKQLNWNKDKKHFQLNYKLEKLLKMLHFKQSQNNSIQPLSFRSQFTRVHSIFSGSIQQDAAEFLYYLLDALDEEYLQYTKHLPDHLKLQLLELEQDDLQTIIENEQPVEIKADENSSDSDENSSADEEEQKIQEPVAQPVVSFEEYQKKKRNIKEYDSQDPQTVWNHAIENKSVLLTKNFLGMLQCEVKCTSCETITKNYQIFDMLPLPINNQNEFEIIEVYLIYNDWSKGYVKSTLKFIPEQTILAELKLQLGEIHNVKPNHLMPCITNTEYVNEFLYHDEIEVRSIQKSLNNDKYLVFMEVLQPISEMVESDLFLGVEIWCQQKRTGFQNFSESTNISIPHIIQASKQNTLFDIYKSIFQSLGVLANSEELLNFIPEEYKQQKEEQKDTFDIFDYEKTIELLGYRIDIQFKLPSNTICPFECGKKFKKETKEHQCGLPLNNSLNLQDYLDKLNNKTQSFITIILNWDQKNPPQELKQKLDIQNKSKTKDMGINEFKNIFLESIENCFKAFQRKELLSLESNYFCNVCNEISIAQQQTQLYMAPNQLILQLKRFHIDHQKGVHKKINKLITYPLTLEIQIQQKNTIYELQGVIQHFGTLENGHYTGLGRHAQDWFEYDDSKVTIRKESEILNDPNAYILIYQLNSQKTE